MDMSQYRELFVAEAREHLAEIGELIVQLEKEPGEKELIDSLFRKAHSIKGMAASMGYRDITELAHKMEDLLDRVRKGAIPFAPGVADLLLEGGDHLSAMVDEIDESRQVDHDLADLLARLADYLPEPADQAAAVPAPSHAGAESLVESTVEPRQTPPEIPAAVATPRESHDIGHTVRVRTEVLDRLINITGELVTNKHRLLDISDQLNSPHLREAVQELARLERELHHEVMKVRLVPFSVICERFPRMVRDLAKRGGKEVSFEIDGREIELDRGLLEELVDPLMHILRNAVDHGIEPPGSRVDVGKPAAGTVRLWVQREKDRAVVAVEDDGRGMDPDSLVRAAVRKGLIGADEGRAMTPAEAYMLTCIPGFSTAAEITDVSGRGVGMDAVRAAIKNIGGSLMIESEKGRGSRVILKLPLTVSIIQVLLVSCGTLTLAVPVTSILRTLELERERVVSQGKKRVFTLKDEVIPLLSLNRLSGQKPGRLAGSHVPVILAELRGRKVGLVVDRFVGQVEVFARPLGRPLAMLKGVTSGAILGDGRVVFILDVPNLL